MFITSILVLQLVCPLPASVERVIDGDTFVMRVEMAFDTLRRVHIRLADIDTPERFTPEGKVVTAAVTARLKECPVTIRPTGAITFARHVAHVTACGEDLKDWIRRHGYEKKKP